MILFWLGALGMVAVALAFVLPPLLGTRPVSVDAQRENHNLEVYRSRIAALDEEHRLGALTEDDLAQARDELGRELLADASAGPVRKSGAGKPALVSRPWLAIAVGVGVPLLAIALYQRLGEPDAIDPPSAAAAGGGGNPAIEEMVARLAQRLASEPDSSEGWLLLGRSYMVLERYAEAADAYSAAHRLLGDSAELLSNLAEAEALMQGQDFLGIPGERLETALRLDPEYPRALWLGAFAAMQRGDTTLAVRRWQSLLDNQPADSEAATILRDLIANADSGTGIGADVAAGADNGGSAVTGNTMAAEARPGLTVNVILADRLAADLDGSETLFVFARAADGPPMPLAVVRGRVSDLPLTVTLDDSMAMAAGMKLSNFDRVVVGARISMSGTPTASSGDLQGFSGPVSAAGDSAVNVAITEKVP
jgi:cytochrome c-type biogenesis protein CcmH